MPKAKLGQLDELRRELIEADRPDRFQLSVGGPGGADEVRLVRVREAVRTGTRRRDDGVLLELQHGVAGTGDRQQVVDHLMALRVGDGMPSPLRDGKPHVLTRGYFGDEPRTSEAARSELEMGVARP